MPVFNVFRRFPKVSITNQKALLEDYARKHGFQHICHYSDDGYSGTNFNRPQWKRLVADIEAGTVGTVICKDMSRVGRDYLQVGFYTEVFFRQHGVRFVAISDSYDSDHHEGGTGGLMVALKFLVHEQYSRDLSEKIKAAKHEKARRGEFVTKNCAFGFVKSAEGKLEIDPDAADTVRLIFSLSSEGKTCPQ